jgi:hypothetical protein
MHNARIRASRSAHPRSDCHCHSRERCWIVSSTLFCRANGPVASGSGPRCLRRPMSPKGEDDRYPGRSRLFDSPRVDGHRVRMSPKHHDGRSPRSRCPARSGASCPTRRSRIRPSECRADRVRAERLRTAASCMPAENSSERRRSPEQPMKPAPLGELHGVFFDVSIRCSAIVIRGPCSPRTRPL